MTRAKRTIRIISTSKITEQITVPLYHHYVDSMITDKVKVEVLKISLDRKGHLVPDTDYIIKWMSNSDMVITIVEVPNEKSIYLAEYLCHHIPLFSIIHASAVMFSKEMNEITWKYWQTIYLPKYFQNVDFSILIPEFFDHTNVIPSIERIFQSLIFALKCLDLTLLLSGLVNLDAADMYAITRDGAIGVLSMGYGIGMDPGRSAVRDAISRIPKDLFPLKAVTGAVINVIGGKNLNIKMAASVADEIKEILNPYARIIWGATIDESMGNKVKIGLGLGVPLKFLRPPIIKYHKHSNS